MRKEFGLILIAVVFSSACVGQTDNTIQNVLTLDVVKGGVEDIAISAMVPEFARMNQDFNWQLLVRPSVMVRDFAISVYDRCVFENTGIDSFAKAELRPNNTEIFKLTYHTPQVEFERSCPVRFNASYISNATLTTSVSVLQDTEYMLRRQAGTLKDIQENTWKSASPLVLSISWGSEGQPLLDNSVNQMYIDYRNNGDGTIERLEGGPVEILGSETTPGQVIIQVPGNLEPSGELPCDDYTWNPYDRTLTLNRDIDFIRKEAKRSTCTFTAKATQPVDSKSLVVFATYRYAIDGSMSIPLLAR